MRLKFGARPPMIWGMTTTSLLLDRAISLTLKAFDPSRSAAERAELLREAMALTHLLAPA